jgi:hypothetical protein
VKLRDAAQQALSLLKRLSMLNPEPHAVSTVAALEDALAQPEPRNQCAETCERARLCAVCSIGLEEAGRPAAGWDDPSVQLVYRMLCDCEEPPPGMHWEGWMARRIVAELAAGQLTSEEIRTLAARHLDESVAEQSSPNGIKAFARAIEQAQGEAR